MTILNLRLALRLPMRCERLFVFSFLIVTMACSKETPAPPAVPAKPVTTTTTTTAAAAEPAPRVSYDEAVIWFRTAPAFKFTIIENGVRGDGEMRRKTVGAEAVTMLVDGVKWHAEAGPKGITWTRDGKQAAAPEWGNRLYQRATVAFDPQKVEGSAQLVAPGHYSFTNANTNELHEVWVANDGHISRMKIGETMEMTIEPIS
jgi:hypothetical protein